MGPFDNFPRQQPMQPQGPFFFADAPQERRDFFAPPPQRMVRFLAQKSRTERCLALATAAAPMGPAMEPATAADAEQLATPTAAAEYPPVE